MCRLNLPSKEQRNEQARPRGRALCRCESQITRGWEESVVARGRRLHRAAQARQQQPTNIGATGATTPSMCARQCLSCILPYKVGVEASLRLFGPCVGMSRPFIRTRPARRLHSHVPRPCRRPCHRVVLVLKGAATSHKRGRVSGSIKRCSDSRGRCATIICCVARMEKVQSCWGSRLIGCSPSSWHFVVVGSRLTRNSQGFPGTGKGREGPGLVVRSPSIAPRNRSSLAWSCRRFKVVSTCSSARGRARNSLSPLRALPGIVYKTLAKGTTEAPSDRGSRDMRGAII